MQTGLMFYGLVDTLFLGRVSAEALAGVGVGSATFHAVFLFALGCLLGIDTLSSRAYGAGKPAVCAAVLVHALALALFFAASAAFAARLLVIFLAATAGAFWAGAF